MMPYFFGSYFLEIYTTFKYNGVSDDVLDLGCFFLIKR